MPQPTYKILLLMKRKPGISPQQLRAYYEDHHVPLALRHGGGGAGLARYVRRYLEPRPNAETGRNDELPHDVITELWFTDEARFHATLAYITTRKMADEVVADEEKLFDRATMRIATVVECETDLSG